MSYVNESDVEKELISIFGTLGYQHMPAVEAGPDGLHPERESNSSALLHHRLEETVLRINRDMPDDACRDALRKIRSFDTRSPIHESIRWHNYIIDGVDVEYYDEDGLLKRGKVRLVDFKNSSKNDFLLLTQFTVVEGEKECRPDAVVFLNGIPIAVIELKSPVREAASLTKAYQQLQTYIRHIPVLFYSNMFLVISDGISARIGTISSKEERFMPWRTIDGSDDTDITESEMSTLIKGVFDSDRLLDLICNFTSYMDFGFGPLKVIAGYHQYYAVRRAVGATVSALSPDGNRKVGVIWHTQGSGKSLLMAFYVGLLARHPSLRNPTILVITDRNDLDDQLFNTFAACEELIRQKPKQATSRSNLRQLIKDTSVGQVIFSTIQKFGFDGHPANSEVLSLRENIIVIADEAHRSHYGLGSHIKQNSGKIGAGFARCLRDSLPNASFIGFTGTPIENDDRNTPAVFGHYIDVYDISKSIDDGITVPLYYESRLVRIKVDDKERPHIDVEVEDLTENDAMSSGDRIAKKWKMAESIVGSQRRLEILARDLMGHLTLRLASTKGKAMVVCMSRRICVSLYNELIKICPHYHSDLDSKGLVKVVMSGSSADPEDWQPHICDNARRTRLARRVRNPEDPLVLVIVCDMWLTGFDAPPMHTMYVDKKMRGHGLMQAIARVNRVFRDKPGGLIVDYIGIAQNLRDALGSYSSSDRANVCLDESELISLMEDKFNIVASMYHGFDYKRGIDCDAEERLQVLAEAVNWILKIQSRAAKSETTDERGVKENRRYQDAILELNKIYALAATTDKARTIRDDVAFFQAVGIALRKTSDVTEGGDLEKDIAVQQIIDRSVIPTGVTDILSAFIFDTDNLSILSDEFLNQIQKMELKNLAIEALTRVLKRQILSRRKSNVVESRKFSERLDAAIREYHEDAINTAKALQELLQLARDMRDAHRRGDESGLSEDEIAFYDALADNQSAIDILGNEKLMKIAHELLVKLKENITIDWSHRESARAGMRVLVKRILNKYGYPPDMQRNAVQTVLHQAEVLTSKWANE